MEEILQYLEMKNHYYQKFYTVTQKFLDKISRNEWEQTEFFVESRDRILSIIRSFDLKISRCISEMEKNLDPTPVEKALLSKISEQKKSLGEKILEIDLRLITAIDDYKTETIKELQRTVKAQQQIDAFERTHQPSPTPSRIGKA